MMCGVADCSFRIMDTPHGLRHVDTHGVDPGHDAVRERGTRSVKLLTQPPAGPVPTKEELAQATDLTPFILHQDIEWTGGLEVHHPPKHQVQR